MKEEIKNEKELTTKEINKSKIQKLRKALSVIEVFLIAIPLVIIGLFFILGVLVGMTGEEIVEEIEFELESVSIEEIMQEKEENMLTGVIISMATCFSYVLNVRIVNKIGKIFKNIEDEDSPFTEKNLDILNTIKKLVIFNFVATLFGSEIGMGLFAVILVYAFVLIFEHGYKIQVEVDETL